MQKIIWLIMLMLLAAAPSLAKAGPLAQSQAGGQAYTVQAEDSLSRLAAKFYQDFAAWPAIQLATNAKAAQDSRFTVIKNPNVSDAGQILWIPDPDEAQRLLAGYAPANPKLQPLTGELLAEFETYIESARQRFEIPGEMDEAAMIDGAGPFRTLISVILPQSWPALMAVGIFHFVYA